MRAGLAAELVAGASVPANAQGAKRGDDMPREDVEVVNSDALQSIAIQVPGFRGPRGQIS